MESRTSTGNAGTTITVDMYAEKPLNVAEGIKYLKDCVGLIDVPVKVNGELISQNVVELHSPTSPQWVFNDRLQLTPDIVGDVEVKGDGTGEVWIQIDNIRMDDTPVHGLLCLRSGANTINTYRSGFSLAPTAVSSVYQFGGIANLGFLKPTAGREALESQSQQLLQTLIQSLDNIVSNEFANHDECDQSTKFMQWVLNHRAFDKCGRITARFEPDQADYSPRGNLGLNVQGIQLYFPLSATLGLALWCPSHRQVILDYSRRLDALSVKSPERVLPHLDAWKNGIRIAEAIQLGTPISSNPENIEHFNSLQVSAAERFVFSSDGDFTLVQEMIRDNPELRFGHRLEEATGKF